MNDRTGGPAFPMLWNAADQSPWQIEGGMSLRDYFAAKVDVRFAFEVVRTIADMEAVVGEPYPGDTLEVLIERLRFYAKASAVLRYIEADAMLKERDHASGS
jgi:hypothetical protein